MTRLRENTLKRKKMNVMTSEVQLESNVGLVLRDSPSSSRIQIDGASQFDVLLFKLLDLHL